MVQGYLIILVFPSIRGLGAFLNNKSLNFTYFPDDIDAWDHISNNAVYQKQKRIWTTSDLEPAFSVLNLHQMQPFFERLEAGNPIKVVAFGDSITNAFGGCYHRDRYVTRCKVGEHAYAYGLNTWE